MGIKAVRPAALRLLIEAVIAEDCGTTAIPHSAKNETLAWPAGMKPDR